MKTLILSFFILILNLSYTQNTAFEQQMAQALQSFSQAKTSEEFITISYKFEQIAMVETQNWLPLYYHALCYIYANYNEKRSDVAKKDAHLDKALQTIKTLKTLVPNESEVITLEALYYTAKLSVNPMERGQKYSVLAQTTIAKALALDPNNVRAKQLKISTDFGTAQFFGTDTSPICKRAQVLLAEWDNFPPKSKIHPNWGKAYLAQIAKSCSEKTTTEAPKTDTATTSGNQLTINISSLSSNEGVVLIQLLDENHKVLQSLKGNIKNNTCQLIIEHLEKGTYAIRYFHDQNTNMKMDKDQYGRPTEGYGYSNNAKGFMGPPKIKKTLFKFDQDLSLYLKTRN